MEAAKRFRFLIESINRNRILFPFFSLTALIIISSLISPYFLTAINIKNILAQVSIIAVLAAGETAVILTGGIDLAPGSLLALGGAVAAALIKWAGLPTLIGILGGLTIGVMAGAINGLLVARVKIPSFIATLAMLAIGRGATLVITSGHPITGFPRGLRAIDSYVGPIPTLIIIVLGLYILSQMLLSYTKLGRYIYAIGGNEQAVRFVGVNVNQVKLFVFIFSGFCAALGGIMMNARLDSATPTAGQGYELDAIAASVLGGVSFTGGVGSLAGTFMGALIMTILGNLLNLLGVSAFYQYIAKGMVLAIAAISLSRGVRFAK